MTPSRAHATHATGAPIALLALVAIAAMPACGRGDRKPFDTADTAAVLSGELMDSARAASLRGDSANADTLHPADSALTATDTAGAEDSAAVTLATPTLVLRADSAAGESLYRAAGRCLTCHGARGEGIAGLGSDLRDTVWFEGDGSVREIQRIILLGIASPKAGRSAMPAFASRLSDEQALRIAEYVYAISHAGVVVDSRE